MEIPECGRMREEEAGCRNVRNRLLTVRFCFVFGIADAQHADIVGLIGAAGKFGYAGKGLMNEILGAVRGRIVEIVNQ
ncbi:hypothetical protein LJB63_19955, partial [[Eubacterium] rectale]|nr:hypothetical protein [Agathobacter rectalis]